MQKLNKPYEGLFVTIEGGEGCGKSTLSLSLEKALSDRGYTVLRTREPGGSPLSEEIRKLLLNPAQGVTIGERAELLLFLASRAQHLEEVILPALRQRQVVVCERFNDSSIAYQGCARHIGWHAVEDLCRLATDSVDPNATLLLDLDPEEGFKRVKAQRGEDIDRMEQEKLQFYKEVRQGFLHLADKYSERIEIIDASLSQEEVLSQSLKALEPHLTLKPTRS